MSTAPFDGIRAALETAVDAANRLTTAPIPMIFPGQACKPSEFDSSNKIWGRAFDLRAGSEASCIGTNGLIRHDGVLMINLRGPNREGTGELTRFASQLMRPLCRAELTADDDGTAFIVQLGVPSLSPVREEPDRLQVSISVPYYAHT